MITSIEELSLNAWPSLQTLLVDGWVLRFANGYTKRANSVNPLYASTRDVEAKIQFCEEIYRCNNLPVVFKMTAAAHPENLDALLDDRGYEVDSPTGVQTMELGGAALSSDARLDATPTEEWLAAFYRLSVIDDARKATLRQMLTSIVPQKCFAAMLEADQIVACGLGVRQDEHIGFYDIVTDTSFRNQGYGKRLMRNLLTWGKQNGARTAYLQVMQNNAPALNLYARLGFKQIYEYWYRIKR
ncbi:MAG: GNAT family N-acetyltransferase [Anaerolineales bacterium]|nr:GNAT family N-acetyltransferase [Anaerolineales bacterium]